MVGGAVSLTIKCTKLCLHYEKRRTLLRVVQTEKRDPHSADLYGLESFYRRLRNRYNNELCKINQVLDLSSENKSSSVWKVIKKIKHSDTAPAVKKPVFGDQLLTDPLDIADAFFLPVPNSNV